MNTDMILTLSALVTAYVGVAKTMGMEIKWSSLLALAIAAILVLVPDYIRDKIIMISMIALSATGAYTLSKSKSSKS